MRFESASGKTVAAMIMATAAFLTAPTAAADPIVLTVIEHATTDAVADIGAKGDSAGDILTFANDVFDASNTNKVGTDQGVCIRVLPKVSWDCRWTLNLPEGQLMVQGPFFDQANSVLAIVGGTGQYAGARGDMQLNHIVPDDSSFQFVYRLS